MNRIQRKSVGPRELVVAALVAGAMLLVFGIGYALGKKTGFAWWAGETAAESAGT